MMENTEFEEKVDIDDLVLPSKPTKMSDIKVKDVKEEPIEQQLAALESDQDIGKKFKMKMEARGVSDPAPVAGRRSQRLAGREYTPVSKPRRSYSWKARAPTMKRKAGKPEPEVTCQLCEFVPSGKNLYRSRTDHLIKVHFSQYFEGVTPITGPYDCSSCPFTARDKHDLLRHLANKHGTLQKLLDAELAKKKNQKS